MLAIGQLDRAADLQSQLGHHGFHHGHYILIVGVGLVALQQRELRVVVLVDALIAKHPPQLVNLVEATDDQPLQVQLDGDPQV